MRVAIGGSHGMLGRALTYRLRKEGHEVIRLVRREAISPDERSWHPETRTIDWPILDDVDAAVNLAGAGIADAKWTHERKSELISSRLDTTATIVSAMRSSKRCNTFLSGSAIGIYGSQTDNWVSEKSPHGLGFLAELCERWEHAARVAQDFGSRVVLLRTGHVLGPHGGFIGKQKLLFKLGLGGKVGSGEQYLSWIAEPDHVRAMIHLLENDVSGPVNLVGPDPVKNAEFTKTYGKSLKRPTVLPFPTPAARLLFGSEMVSEALMGGQRVRPDVLAESGFEWQYPELDAALQYANKRL